MFSCPALTIRNLSKCALHPLKVTNFARDIIEMGARHTIGIRARQFGVMRKFKKLANLINGKAEFAAAPDERQTLHRGVVVLAIPVARPTRGG